MQLVGPPLAELPPNPICTLNDRVFVVSSFVKAAKDVSILYFSPLNGSVVYHEPTNLRHIGQYFVVRGFGKTRLYTFLLSQRKEKRQLREQLLSSIIPGNQRLLRMPIAENPLSQTIDSFSGQTATAISLQGNMTPLNIRGANEQSLPLIIKRYGKPAGRFTNQLYMNLGSQILIQGPKGRGLCLEAVPPGDVVLIAGGTGLFPFLDLVDELFKIVIGSRGMFTGMYHNYLN